MTVTTDRTELLARCPLFTGLEAAQLELLASSTTEVDFPAGHVIARQGEIGTGFFVIADGLVRIVRDGTTLATLRPGEFFGEMSVLDREPRVAQALAESPTRCLALASWDFERVLLENPPVAVGIARGLARRLRATMEQHRA